MMPYACMPACCAVCMQILGLLLVEGTALPAKLKAMNELEYFEFHAVDPSQVVIRQFVSCLLVGKSPIQTLTITYTREMLDPPQPQ